MLLLNEAGSRRDDLVRPAESQWLRHMSLDNRRCLRKSDLLSCGLDDVTCPTARALTLFIMTVLCGHCSSAEGVALSFCKAVPSSMGSKIVGLRMGSSSRPRRLRPDENQTRLVPAKVRRTIAAVGPPVFGSFGTHRKWDSHGLVSTAISFSVDTRSGSMGFPHNTWQIEEVPVPVVPGESRWPPVDGERNFISGPI
jgi:hypothetical protein